MHTKPFIYKSILIISLLTIFPSYISTENQWWDNNWSFRQEIIIPFDTGSSYAKYQPIDTRIEFNNPCWVKNKTDYSIRVVSWDGNRWNEIDSQIYDLEYRDENHIDSCSIVFLIPEYASGNEQYFVYYDDTEKNRPNYKNYVDVEESYYRIEPISGYPLESEFYKIVQEEYIIYAISLDGQFMGYNTSQHVTRMNEKTTQVIPKNGDVFASFDFKYSYGKGLFDLSSTSQHLISKEIFEDGNLMIEVGIVSSSIRDDMKTTATYKYYYCPTSNKRIHAHIKHETLNEIKLDADLYVDGFIAQLRCFNIKSNSIDDLNFGKILPNMHVYDVQDNVLHYLIDTDPEYVPENPIIRILKYNDNLDLGDSAWISFDEGEEGIVHSLILGSNTIIKSGTDEKDGVQVNAFVMDFPHLPGLENNMAVLEFGRNSYEDNNHDLIIPSDLVIEFDADFYSSEIDGFDIVQSEADIFQELVRIKPISYDDFNNESNNINKHELSVYVHFAPSMLFGSELSAFLGRDFPYINVEIYKNEDFISSGTANKLPMKPIYDIDKLTPIQQIRTFLTSFDIRNISFFKKIIFSDLDEGKYIIRVYRENQLLGSHRKYIGYKTIDLDNDQKTRIYCSCEGSLEISVSDQKGKSVENAEVILLEDNYIISINKTNPKGITKINAPCSLNKRYSLIILYDGFEVFNESIRIGYKTILIPIKKSVNINRCNLELEIFDKWSLPIEVDINPVLTSNEMYKLKIITANKISSSNYLFENLLSSNYILKLKYKSFSYEQLIDINNDKKLRIDFVAEFNTNIKILDSRGNILENTRTILSRNNKELVKQFKDSKEILSLPPGRYNIEIYDNDNNLIGKRAIDIFEDRNYNLLTNHEPLFPLIITIIMVFLIIISLFLSYVKKEKMYFILILTISILIISLFSPWWMIRGSSDNIETTTKMFIIPLELVTLTTTPNVISGELAYLPDIFIEFVGFLPILTVLSCIIIIFCLFLFIKDKKKYFTLSLLISFLFMIISLLIFFIGISTLAEVGIGSFIGEGPLDVSIPGEDIVLSMSCSWNPYLGFFTYIISIIIIFIIFILNLGQLFKKKIDK